MAQHIVLLRGINVGSHNRVAMPRLRDVLGDAGFEDVRTYVQSGNIVLSSTGKAEEVARTTRRLIKEEFGLEIPVITRTRAQLAKIVEANPLGQVARNPKLYQVSFFERKPSGDIVQRAEEVATASERIVAIGREIYAWHPDGAARSKLWAFLASQKLGITATARNWTTVTKLLQLAGQ
jgi:uncharacterized protein (DUF1697 family)